MRTFLHAVEKISKIRCGMPRPHVPEYFKYPAMTVFRSEGDSPEGAREVRKSLLGLVILQEDNNGLQPLPA